MVPVTAGDVRRSAGSFTSSVQDPAGVRTILAHLGLSGAADLPGPAPPAPAASA